MATTMVHTDYISQSSSRSRKQRVIQAQFGDGYSQEVPDGINSQLDMWNIVYEAMPTSVRNDVITMLHTVGSTGQLSWTPPGGSAQLFKVSNEGYNESWLAGDISTISFAMREVK